MIKEEDLKYIRKAGCSESVIEHSVAATKKALEIADSVTFSVDRDLVKKGAINHDIGRAKTHDLDHFVVGAEIAREYGLEEDVVRIIERHIGAGITKQEAVSLGLPPKDYIPETAEEIIVCYADSITHHITYASHDETVEKFRRRIGKDHPVVERFSRMHRLVESWIRNSR